MTDNLSKAIEALNAEPAHTQHDWPLVQAIAALGAVEVAPGTYARLCDHENCTAMGIGPQKHTGPRWFIMVPGALELLAEDLRTGKTSEGWCSLKGDPVMMPAWWSPELQAVQEVTLPDGRVMHVRLDDYARDSLPAQS